LEVAVEARVFRIFAPSPRLKEGQPLDQLHRSYDKDAELNESYVVLSIGAGLIATFGLVSDNAAVVIGAMVVAPWIHPLRTGVFAILVGDWGLLRRASRTLSIGVASTVLLAVALGLWAGGRGLLLAETMPAEISGRVNPNLIDLAIALVAGAMATYAKVKPSAVSSMAGTSIAVALVPPVCVMGLMISCGYWANAEGAGLLFAANLLGILIGGVTVLAIREPYLRGQLLTSRRTKIPFVGALVLMVVITVPLSKRFNARLYDKRMEVAQQKIEENIRDFLKGQTLTFGANDSLALNSIEFDWPNFWEKRRYPTVEVVVRVTNPNLPSFKQVQIIQDLINEKVIGSRLEGLKFQVQVQRINVSVVEGREVKQQDASTPGTPLLTPQQTRQVLEQGPLELDSDPEQTTDGNQPVAR
jgi:uncharacterized hydrophobic protein (TIGR00271 family)